MVHSLFENITSIYGRHFLSLQQKNYSIVNLFKSDRILANKLDQLECEKPELIDSLIEKTNNLSSKIKKYKLRSWLLENPQNQFWKIALNKLGLIIGLPAFCFGFVFNALPFFIIDTVIRKKIKEQAFWSSSFLVLGFTVFPIFYLMEFAAVSWLIPGIWLKLAFLISLPFAGKLTFKWYILFLKTAGRSHLLLLKWCAKEKYKNLLAEREELFGELDGLMGS
jgi:hypothetical protein